MQFDIDTQTVNVSTVRDAEVVFDNSGWADRLENTADTRTVAEFVRKNCSADIITEDEFNSLMKRFAMEVCGWSENDF